MSVLQGQPLPALWKERLDLSTRDVPDLFEDSSAVGPVPHANAIRMTLDDLGRRGGVLRPGRTDSGDRGPRRVRT